MGEQITVYDEGKAYYGSIVALIIDEEKTVWIQGAFYPRGEGRSAIRIEDTRVKTFKNIAYCSVNVNIAFSSVLPLEQSKGGMYTN